MAKHTKKKTHELIIQFRIKSIDTLKFSYTAIPTENSETTLNESKLSLNLSVDINKDDSEIIVVINSSLNNSKLENPVLEHACKTVFYLSGMDNFLDQSKKELLLPKDLTTEMVSMAYTHARAVLAVEVSKTMYKDKIMLPIIADTFFIELLDKNFSSIKIA